VTSALSPFVSIKGKGLRRTRPEGLGRCRLSPNELAFLIALDEQQGGEVGVVDPRLYGGGYKRLGMEGDPEAGGRQHR
jgi:hypothetical protein